MLVLSRRTDQDILIPDRNIIIRVLKIRGSRVSLGIEAPDSVKILRAEVPLDSRAACGPRCDAGAENRDSSGSFPIQSHDQISTD